MDSQETLALLKDALSQSNEDLAKSWVQSNSATTGLTAYDLEGPAKTLYPVLTPLRNSIPRVSGKGGIQANWKAVTAIDTGKMMPGVSEGLRGGVVSTTVVDYLAAYRGIGLEDSVTFEAQYAAEGYEDVRARATQGLLRSLMIAEEKLILGGNTSLALSQTPQPTLSAAGTGSALTATAYSVICVALTPMSFERSTVAGGVVDRITRTTADGTTETINAGAAQRSTNTTTTPTAGQTITASVTPVRGAVGYAWFWGAAGSEVLGAITTVNSVAIAAAATGTQAANTVAAADYSRCPLVFDGLLTFAANSASNGYWNALPTGNTGLTAGTDGTIAEIDTALKWFWDTYRLSPTAMMVSSQEMQFIRKKVLQGGTAAAQRFVFTTTQNGIVGGTAIKGYLNPFTMDGSTEIPIKLHPNMPSGTILFDTDVIPYPLSGVTNVRQVRTRQEYYSVEWPRRARKYEYGVYADEVLQHYAPFSTGAITNIAGS